MISCDNYNSNIIWDNNSWYAIIFKTLYDFFYKFKNLRFSNNRIIIMCMI